MKRFVIFLTALCLALSVRAQDGESLSGGEVLPFLRLSSSPVTSGMAGANLSSTTGVDYSYAALENFVSVPFMEKRFSAGASFGLWMPSVSKDLRVRGGFSVRAGKIVGISGGVSWGGQQPYELDGKTVKPFDLVAGAGISVAVAPRFSLGAGVKYARQQFMPNAQLSSFSVSLLAQYHGKRFNVMGGVIGLGPKVMGDDEKKYSQPSSVKLAGDYVFQFGLVNLQLAADADYYFSKNFSVAGGLQLGVKDWVFVRGGYRYASAGCAVPSHLAIGIGGGYAGVTLNASLLTLNKELGNSFLIGLGYSF